MSQTILYSHHYAPIDVEKELQKTEESCKQNADHPKMPPYSFQECIAAAEARYGYRERKDAAENAERFALLATHLSETYEIGLELTKDERRISATLELPFGPYLGYEKRLLDALFGLADCICVHSEPERVIVSMDYCFYDRYRKDTGERADW